MKSEHKVVITGTGRAGTTFLVQLLTDLGLDTGFTPEEARRQVANRSRAGLERRVPVSHGRPTVRDWWRQPKHTFMRLVKEPPAGPYIVKNPALCDELEQILADGRFVIDHVYIPMRDLESAALSRARVGGGNGTVPGGLWKTADPREQKAVLAEMFFHLVHTLTAHEVPHTFLLFPRLVDDWAYACHKLWFLVKEIDPERFRASHQRLAHRELIHDFKGVSAGGAPVAATVDPAPADRRPQPAAAAPTVPAVELRSRIGLAAGRWQRMVHLLAWIGLIGSMNVTMGDRLTPVPPPAAVRAVTPDGARKPGVSRQPAAAFPSLPELLPPGHHALDRARRLVRTSVGPRMVWNPPADGAADL